MLKKSRFSINNANSNEYNAFYPIGLWMCYNNIFFLQKQQMKNFKLIKNSPTKQPVNTNITANQHSDEIQNNTQNNTLNNSTLMKFFDDNAL